MLFNAQEPGVQARAEQGEKRWAGQEHRFHTRSGSGELNPRISHCKKAIQKASPGKELERNYTQQEARRDADTADPPAVPTLPPPILSVPGTVGCPHHRTQLENQ